MKNLLGESEKRSDLAKMLIGFITTFLIGLATKVITLMMSSDTSSDIILYLVDNFPFWVQLFVASGSGGYFAQKWTQKK